MSNRLVFSVSVILILIILGGSVFYYAERDKEVVNEVIAIDLFLPNDSSPTLPPPILMNEPDYSLDIIPETLPMNREEVPGAEIATVNLSTSTTEPRRTTDPALSALIGQLFMIGHWANTSNADTTNLIRDNYLGGVIIMSAPADPNDIGVWTAHWRKNSPINLLVAIDQEGNPVTRLKGTDFIQTSQRDIDSEEQALAVGRQRGAELSRLGINVNFSPVLDSARNPNSFMYKRVFPDRGTSPNLAAAMIDGLASSGVTGVAKHFPGHDDTVDDSHFILPLVNIEKNQLREFTSPFETLIRANNTPAIMTAHVAFPKIDPKPATLSRFFLTEYLRNTLGFSGVIITDDMSMKAITDHYPKGEAAVLALEAGADMILFAAEPMAVLEAIIAVEQAVLSGRLSPAKLEESVERLSRLRP